MNVCVCVCVLTLIAAALSVFKAQMLLLPGGAAESNKFSSFPSDSNLIFPFNLFLLEKSDTKE